MKNIFEQDANYVLIKTKRLCRVEPTDGARVRIGDMIGDGEVVKVFKPAIIETIDKHGERYL